MMRRRIKLIALALMFGACLASAGTMSVRLVHATDAEGGMDPRLSDISGILGSLRFESFSLLDSDTVRLPAEEVRIRMAQGYTLTCNGTQGDLAIEMNHNGQSLLKTTATLRRGKPLILGGFPTREGKIILVLKVE